MNIFQERAFNHLFVLVGVGFCVSVSACGCLIVSENKFFTSEEEKKMYVSTESIYFNEDFGLFMFQTKLILFP